MSGTSVRYTGHDGEVIEVLRDGRVASKVALDRFCAIDEAMGPLARHARENPGQEFAVPGDTRRPRNARPCCILL